MGETYIASAAQIFTLFFVMLGPLRLLKPFADASRQMTPEQLPMIAWKSNLIAAVSLVIGGFFGASLMESWKIPAQTLELTGGIIFLLSALILILRPMLHRPPEKTEAEPVTAAGTAFSMILTPYGAATLIVLLSLSQSSHRTLVILSILLTVLVLNWLAMHFIRQIMGTTGSMLMAIIGSALSVLQAALALQIILLSVRSAAGAAGAAGP